MATHDGMVEGLWLLWVSSLPQIMCSLVRHAPDLKPPGLDCPPTTPMRTRAAAADKRDGGAARLGPHQGQLVPQKVLDGGEEGGRLLLQRTSVVGTV